MSQPRSDRAGARLSKRSHCVGLVIALGVVLVACDDEVPTQTVVVCCEPGCPPEDAGPDVPVDAADAQDEPDVADAVGDVIEDVELVDVPTDRADEDLAVIDIQEDVVPDAAEVDSQLGPPNCVSCHGSGSNPAPPVDTQGRSETSLLTVGAHRGHLADSHLFRTVVCRDCHIVPGVIEEPQHIDLPPAELTWGAIPRADGVLPELREDGTCNVYCHGASLRGGTQTEPNWTIVDGSQVYCGSCHGVPPTEGHPQVAVDSCGGCHPFFGGPENHELHVNGILEVSVDCTSCHGGGDNPAPPVDTLGRSDTSLLSVGAHREHLRDSDQFRSVACPDCHIVPGVIEEPQHIDVPPAELTWGSVPQADGVVPELREDGTCNVYCHGVSLSGGTLTEPSWTIVDGSQVYCGSCHGIPPTERHPQVAVDTCGDCHPFSGGPENHELHVNGILEASSECGDCHGIPPASGAHLTHFSETPTPEELDTLYGDLRRTAELRPGGTDGYLFGCGNCHPADLGGHLNGLLDVELYDADLYVAPPYDPVTNPEPATLKGRNPPTAAYADGSCTDVYCHSTGQEEPTFGTTPPWEGGVFEPSTRCDQCHDNPPAYPTGESASMGANAHIVVDGDGFLWGHFDTMHWFHQSGAESPSGSPVTCQSCHYETVDPANTGDSGFYYLDTTSLYDHRDEPEYSCTGAGCHSGAPGDAPMGTGAVLTARHVDGSRDVIFDPRNAIPSEVNPPWFPQADERPTYPYWIQISGPPSLTPPEEDYALDGLTWSVHLSSAQYDPETKTCSNIACHIGASYGSCLDPLLWGPQQQWCSCHTNFYCP